MRYKFKNFEFNSTNLVLTKNGDIVAIRHNEAKVLQVLLEQAEKVLSKEDILSLVWQDKVVSDQAVFQNISHLRNIFGGEAIKTFSKRGYQWQLNVEIITTEQLVEPSKNHIPVKDLKEEITTSHNYKSVLMKAVVLFAVMFSVLIIYNNIQQIPSRIQVGVIPFSDSSLSKPMVLSGGENFEFSEINGITAQGFDAAAELEYLKIAETHSLILNGYIRQHGDKFYLDFLLKGPFGEWKGQLMNLVKNNLKATLLTHLNQPFIIELLNKQQSPETKQANLLLAHQQSPDDLIILGQLTRSYIHINEYDKAMALTDKLIHSAKAQNNQQQVGNALLYQSAILTEKGLLELSSTKLNLAIDLFEQVGDLKRQADSWDAQSWLDHRRGNYQAVKTSLLKAAQLAFEVNDIERELHALTYLSVLAHKHNEHDDKYHYLTQAENKMKSYQLPVYRYAKIPFHHAIYTDDPLAKEPHLRQVLEYTKLTPDHWVAQSSRQQLMDYYIAYGRLEDAKGLISDLRSENAENVFLKTLLAQASNEQEAFVANAQLTFELAQLSGNQELSLDVALLLCSSDITQVNFDFYSQYINEHANIQWRRSNKSKLTAINM